MMTNNAINLGSYQALHEPETVAVAMQQPAASDHHDVTKEKAPWFAGNDLNAFIALLLNNVATLLAVCSILVGTDAKPGPLGPEIVYGRLVPGVGWAMLFGCLYYYWMAWRLIRSTGRSDVCGQPYGINTPGAFAFVFNIILVDFLNGDVTASVQDRQEHAWRVGVAANFIAAAILLIGSLFGPWIEKYAPRFNVPLLTSLSGIGIAFLGINTILDEMQYPLEGMIALLFFFLSFFGKVKFYVPGTRIELPAALLSLIVGSTIGWMDDVTDAAAVRATGSYIKAYAPIQSVSVIFQNLGSISSSISIILPVAITVAVGTVQCVMTAQQAGDCYSMRDSMVGDGTGTLIGASMGSPLGMTVFIGHPVFKRMGARTGYLLLTAVSMWFLCTFGLIAPLNKIIVNASVQPILLAIGLDLCRDTLALTPKRHYPAFILGIMPSLANWASGIGGSSSDNPTVANGLANLGNGNILVSIFLTAIMMAITDRDFFSLAAWSFVASLLSFVGMIHSPKVGWLVKKTDISWRFALAYLCVVIVALVFLHFQKLGRVDPPRTDESEEEADKLEESQRLHLKSQGDQQQEDACCPFLSDNLCGSV